jgi:hypothetical protein
MQRHQHTYVIICIASIGLENRQRRFQALSLLTKLAEFNPSSIFQDWIIHLNTLETFAFALAWRSKLDVYYLKDIGMMRKERKNNSKRRTPTRAATV